MKRINLRILWFPLIVLFLLAAADVSVNAEEQKDEKPAYLVIAGGIEYLSYTEYEPRTGSYVDTSLQTMVLKLEGGLNLNPIFLGLKGVFPASPEEGREAWVRSGRIYQTNYLEYSLTRMDGNVGYNVYPWLSPYLGVRWSRSRQERGDFILSKPVSGKSSEITNALYAAAGLKGVLTTPTPWQFQYSLECFIPVYARTVNSALSGFKSTDNGGYSVGARAVAEYKFSPSVSLYYELSGEKVKWDGSGWINYSGGSAKWPKNETVLLNCMMGISWGF